MSSCETRRPGRLDVCGLLRTVRAWRQVTGAKSRLLAKTASKSFVWSLVLYSFVQYDIQ